MVQIIEEIYVLVDYALSIQLYSYNIILYQASYLALDHIKFDLHHFVG